MNIFWRELNLFQIKQLTLVTVFLKVKKIAITVDYNWLKMDFFASKTSFLFFQK